MFKSRRSKVLLTIFIILAIITVYFYNLHYVTVKSIQVNEPLNLGDETLFINEIQWRNYDPDDSQPSSLLLWWLNTAATVNAPLEIVKPVMKILHFYSKPGWVKNNNIGNMVIAGLCASGECYNADRHFWERYDVSVFDEKGTSLYASGRGSTWSGDSNLVFFYTNLRKTSKDIRTIRITLTDKELNTAETISLDLHWAEQHYSFFDRKPGKTDFALSHNITEVAHALGTGDKAFITPFILPERLSEFPWDCLRNNCWDYPRTGFTDYEGKYLGFNHVFSYNAEFLDPDDFYKQDFNTDQIIASQKIYLIMSNEQWKIIDLGPMQM